MINFGWQRSSIQGFVMDLNHNYWYRNNRPNEKFAENKLYTVNDLRG